MANPFVAQVEKQLLRGDFSEAIRLARMGLALHPDSPALWELAAGCATELGDDACAALCWQRFIELVPAAAYAYNDLGVVLERLGRAAEAEVLYRTALQFDPDFAAANSNLGVLLTDAGREHEAESCFRAALASQPDFQQVSFNLAQLLLRQGRFAEGWPLHEGRLFVHAQANTPVNSNCRQWQGEPLAGKTILIVPEQGLGDEIQFCRYVPWLKAQGAARVTLACWPSQQTLMESLAGPDVVISVVDLKSPAETHDYWTFLLSLPLHARTELTSIPAQRPYLFADAARVAAHGPLAASEGLRIGLVWRGNPGHSNDGDRSLPSLDVLAPLWSIERARFFSLQKSKTPLPVISDRLPLVDLAPLIDDCADTAALLSQLDLLISVDTAVAHLAGALGVPCWILLPCFKTDWRWLSGRSDSPWYPRTRLFRQTRRGDWQSPVAQMVLALSQLNSASVADSGD